MRYVKKRRTTAQKISIVDLQGDLDMLNGGLGLVYEKLRKLPNHEILANLLKAASLVVHEVACGFAALNEPSQKSKERKS